MKIRTKINIIIVGSILLLGAALFLTAFRAFENVKRTDMEQIKKLIDNEVTEISTLTCDSLERQLKNISFRALSMASLFSMDSEIVKIYKTALKGNIDDPYSPESEYARNMLREHFKSIIKGYTANTGNDTLKIHFHLPNGRSLARLWRNGYQTIIDGKKVDICDNLSSFRKGVIQVNKKPYSPVSGVEIGRGGFSVRGIVPITDSRGNHLGSVEVLFPFSEVFKNMAGDGKTLFAAYMNADMLEIARSLKDPDKYPVIDNKYVLTDATDSKTTNELVSEEILDRGSKERYRTITGNYSVTSFPVKDFSGKTVGVLVAARNISTQLEALSVTKKDINRNIQSFIMLFTAILAALIAATSIAGYFMVKLLTVSLTKIDLSLAEIAKGGGDLTTELTINSSDEIGSLASSFNSFIGTLREMIIRIKKSVENTIKIKKDLDSHVENSVSAVTEITANINNTIKSIRTLEDTISAAGNNTGDIQQEVKDLDDIIRKQTDAVANSSAAVNEMVASIKNVASITEGKKETTGKLLDNTEKGKMVIASTIKAINDIEKNIESISGMVTLINNISAQTNLLAMNAAIEAAHAGEAGKGFSVVADEIRKLAESTSGNAKDIKTEIKTIIDRIKEAVAQGDKSSKNFAEISMEVNGVYNAFTEILASTKELSEGGTEILKSIDILNTISGRVKTSSGNISSNISGVNTSIMQVNRISMEVSEAIREIGTGAGEIEKIIEDVSISASALSEETVRLKNETDSFKTE